MSGPSLEQRRSISIRLTRWTIALKHAVAEHGRPNSFGVVELAVEYGLRKRDGYFFGQKYMFDLWQMLGGRDGWGSCPTYAKGRFYV